MSCQEKKKKGWWVDKLLGEKLGQNGCATATPQKINYKQQKLDAIFTMIASINYKASNQAKEREEILINEGCSRE